MTDIPRTVKYEFLLILFGLLLIGWVIYTTYFVTLPQKDLSVISSIGIIIGFFLILNGVSTMGDEAEIDLDTKESEYFVKRQATLETLKNKGVITSDEYTRLIREVKKKIIKND